MDGNLTARLYPFFRRGGLACAAGFVAALWIGLLLAEIGYFAAWPTLLSGLLAGALAWWHGRNRVGDIRPEREGHPGGFAAACALALLSLAFTLPPSEFILGGWDPGVYVHTAAVLAQDGTLRPSYPDLAAMAAPGRALIGRQGQHAWEPFLGMRMLPDGHLTPQFYHLYPVLMALAWPFGGVRAALMVNPLLNALCIMLLYLWACRWMRPRWAFAAALLLALNPAQVWQAGFSTAELLAQCLLLIGLVATERALSGRMENRLDALMAGAAFGLMLLTRYDAILFVVPFILVLLTGLRDKAQRGQCAILIGTTAVLGVQVWAHQRWLAPLYYPSGNLVVPGLIVAGIAALLIATGSLLCPRRIPAAAPAASGLITGLRVAAVAGFLAWIFLACYVRPHLTVEGRVLALFTQLFPRFIETDGFAFIVGRNARNFWYLQSVFGTAGLVVALAGVGLLMIRTRTTWRTAWLAGSLGVLVLLMTNISHEPFMMFAARRMVPVILPLLCIGAAMLADRIEGWLRAYPRRGTLVATLVLGLTVAGTFEGAVFMATHREWPGLVNWYDQLTAGIPREAMVFSDQPGFAAPLRFLYGIKACEVKPLSPGGRRDPMTLMTGLAAHQDVFWLTSSPVPAEYAISTTPTSTHRLDSVILGSRRHAVPCHLRPRGGTFTLYRITPPAGPLDTRDR